MLLGAKNLPPEAKSSRRPTGSALSDRGIFCLAGRLHSSGGFLDTSLTRPWPGICPRTSKVHLEMIPLALTWNGYSSGKLTWLWKITIFNGKTHYKWPFSIAMLVYQRVCALPNIRTIIVPYLGNFRFIPWNASGPMAKQNSVPWFTLQPWFTLTNH